MLETIKKLVYSDYGLIRGNPQAHRALLKVLEHIQAEVDQEYSLTISSKVCPRCNRKRRISSFDRDSDGEYEPICRECKEKGNRLVVCQSCGLKKPQRLFNEGSKVCQFCEMIGK